MTFNLKIVQACGTPASNWLAMILVHLNTTRQRSQRSAERNKCPAGAVTAPSWVALQNYLLNSQAVKILTEKLRVLRMPFLASIVVKKPPFYTVSFVNTLGNSGKSSVYLRALLSYSILLFLCRQVVTTSTGRLAPLHTHFEVPSRPSTCYISWPPEDNFVCFPSISSYNASIFTFLLYMA